MAAEPNKLTHEYIPAAITGLSLLIFPYNVCCWVIGGVAYGVSKRLHERETGEPYDTSRDISLMVWGAPAVVPLGIYIGAVSLIEALRLPKGVGR